MSYAAAKNLPHQVFMMNSEPIPPKNMEASRKASIQGSVTEPGDLMVGRQARGT